MDIIERAIRKADLDRAGEVRQHSVLTRRNASGGCVTGKRRYRDGRQTTDRLHRIANMRAAADAAGVTTNRRECRAYDCPYCNGRHLTSITAEQWAQKTGRG